MECENEGLFKCGKLDPSHVIDGKCQGCGKNIKGELEQENQKLRVALNLIASTDCARMCAVIARTALTKPPKLRRDEDARELIAL